MTQDLLDNACYPRVISAKPKVGDKSEFMQEMAGIIMTFQRRARPLR